MESKIVLDSKVRKQNSAGLSIREYEGPTGITQGSAVDTGFWLLKATFWAGPYLGRDGSRVVLKEEALETVDPQPFLFLVLGLG